MQECNKAPRSAETPCQTMRDKLSTVRLFGKRLKRIPKQEAY